MWELVVVLLDLLVSLEVDFAFFFLVAFFFFLEVSSSLEEVEDELLNEEGEDEDDEDDDDEDEDEELCDRLFFLLNFTLNFLFRLPYPTPLVIALIVSLSAVEMTSLWSFIFNFFPTLLPFFRSLVELKNARATTYTNEDEGDTYGTMYWQAGSWFRISMIASGVVVGGKPANRSAYFGLSGIVRSKKWVHWFSAEERFVKSWESISRCIKPLAS